MFGIAYSSLLYLARSFVASIGSHMKVAAV
jgi:hypothetical protein